MEYSSMESADLRQSLPTSRVASLSTHRSISLSTAFQFSSPYSSNTLTFRSAILKKLSITSGYLFISRSPFSERYILVCSGEK